MGFLVYGEGQDMPQGNYGLRVSAIMGCLLQRLYITLYTVRLWVDDIMLVVLGGCG